MITAKTVGINAETATKIVINFLKVGNQNVFIVKKLLLTLAFVFVISFGFAGIKTSSYNDVVLVDCFDFTLSCGIDGTVCGRDI